MVSMRVGIQNLTFFVIFAMPVTALSFERFDVGDSAYVACESVTIYDAPTAFSVPVSNLKFGVMQKVAGLEKMFELPDTDFSSKKALTRKEQDAAQSEERRPNPIAPEQYTRAAWLKFNNGYGAASCFVTKTLFESQKPEEAQKRVDALAAGKAKRNFSEDESGDMTAMRGAAGKAKGGKADYEAMDALISAAQGSFDLGSHETFRRNGKLGEFK